MRLAVLVLCRHVLLPACSIALVREARGGCGRVLHVLFLRLAVRSALGIFLSLMCVVILV